MIKDLSDNHLFNNYPCKAEDAEIESLRQQSAAQLAELNAISEALGTNEGHSSVDHIVVLREQLADSQRQVMLLRGAMNRIAFSRVGQCESLTQELFNREMWAAEALAATEKTTENQKETTYAELVANSINGKSKQQRKLDCPLEMGQLLEGGTNTKASDTKPQELQLVIWKHKGEGRIEDQFGNYIGTFNGDFRHRDSLICAVNSEATLRQQLAAAQETLKDHGEIQAALCKQLADAQAEVEEESAVREKLAKLLAETAIALKGEEAALTKHSWHDLAQCATEVINERDDHIKREVMLRDAILYVYEHYGKSSFDWHYTEKALAATADLDGLILCHAEPCRDDGRCQYAIDHGAEGLGHCPEGKCCMQLYRAWEPTSGAS